MKEQQLSRFSPRAVAGLYRFLGLSLIARVLTDAQAGVWRVHTGELFPWRHLPIVPLYPPLVLALEWLVLLGSGALLVALRWQKLALRLALLGTLMALSQRYANQMALTLIILLFCNLQPVRVEHAALGPHPQLGLVRLQLLVVYFFSALHKLQAGFWEGQALVNLLHVSPVVGQLLAFVTLLAELGLPAVFLLGWRKLGLLGVMGLHVGFMLALPGLLPFTLTLVALAWSWQRGPEVNTVNIERAAA